MPRSTHQGVMLLPHDLRNDLDWTKTRLPPGGQQNSGFVARPAEIQLPVPESDLLHDWLTDASATPLLIVAPVGAGKSWLLESFAQQMVVNLLSEHGADQVPPIPPVVPLLVPLSVVGGRPLRDFLYKKAEIHSTPRGAKPVLTGPLLDRLIRDRRLVLLIDGFDEVSPHLRQQFESQINELGIPFALTSRPGHGAERFVHTKRQHTLQELTRSTAREYVRCYFTAIPCTGYSPTSATALFDESLSGPIAHLLTRPLHLKAWCDHVHHAPDHHAPGTLGELAKRLLASYIERRQLFQPLRVVDKHGTGEYSSAIAAFSGWLGRLGCYFATRDFGERKFDAHSTDSEVRKLHADANLVAYSRNFSLWDAAIDSGLLVKVGDDYYLPKVPLIEYCIGKYLADDLIANPERPTLLIQSFRRWIWKPTLHGILDYTFDALWHGDVTSGRRWAGDLLRWAVDVDRHDLTRPKPLRPLTESDLVRPFSLTALRWYDINARPSEAELDQAADSCEEALLSLESLLDRGGNIVPLCEGPNLSGWLLMPFCGALFERYRNHDSKSDPAEIFWRLGTEAALKRARGNEVREILTAIFLSINNIDNDLGANGLSSLVILASQISEDQAAAVIPEWIQYCNGFPNDQIESAWQSVIVQVAGRVRAVEAQSLIQQWIAIYVELKSKCWKKVTWRDAIGKAARRVSPNVAADVAREWISQYLAAHSADARAIWWTAICNVVFALRPQDALGIVRDLIRLHNTCHDEDFHSGDVWLAEKGHHHGAKWMWELAIPFAAARVSEDAAANILEDFLQLSDSACDEATRTVYLDIIASAAERLNPIDAPNIIRLLIERYRSASEDADLAGTLLQAIVAASTRIPHDSAPNVVDSLFAALHLPISYNVDRRSRWMRAIMGASGCAETKDEVDGIIDVLIKQAAAAQDEKEITPTWSEIVENATSHLQKGDVVDLVTAWTTRWRDYGWGCKTGLLLRAAICSAAPQVDEAAVPRLVDDLIALTEAIETDQIEFGLRYAIELAAERAREDDVEAVLRQMISAGMVSSAIGVAVTRQDVVIIGRLVNGGLADDQPQFQAYRRESGSRSPTVLREFILDPELSIAPACIRDALDIFPKTEGLSPKQQFELLLTSMPNSILERCYDEMADGHPRDNFRSRWCANVREIGIQLNLLDESNDMRSIHGFVWVRRARFDALLKDQRVADEISRRLLARPSKTKKNRKSS